MPPALEFDRRLGVDKSSGRYYLISALILAACVGAALAWIFR